MSVDRSRSAHETQSTQQREIDARLRADRLREPPPPEQVDKFRTLMQQREGGTPPPMQEQLADARHAGQAVDAQLAAQSADDALAASRQALSNGVDERALRRSDDFGLSANSQTPADASAMWQAQMALRDGTPAPAAPPPPVNPQAFAELIQRHVQQLAASDGALKDSDGQVLLRMADATLPGTDLLLTRTSNGWLLRADVRSRDSYDAIRQAAPELTRRFAASNLGELTIDPHYQG
ncbi:hypothetical protein IP90_03148 [Luteimonas cucumeris]|uniref:Uncharacterized protein n=1 Tax=Luteimonas cucumeris TaxID=985012 RepID=A0A562KVG2_9GAMM|nr:hypothetical protein [Luteimonas cucumeris]TWH99409.1 hypothetical protein IP90_03148 [Luteimonas cucumeris]